ncbi:HNH endonuclease [Luteitalea sp.]
MRRRPTVQVRAAAVAHDEKRAEEKPWRRWYNTQRWQRLRRQVLLDEPLCMCRWCEGGKKRVRPSTVVDHKRPHRGDPILFWDRENLQGMNKRCHDSKTGRGG